MFSWQKNVLFGTKLEGWWSYGPSTWSDSEIILINVVKYILTGGFNT